MHHARAAALLSVLGLGLVAVVLVARDYPWRVSLGTVSSYWAPGAPGWWSKIPVYGSSGALRVDGIPVQGWADPPMQRQAVVLPAAAPYHAWYAFACPRGRVHRACCGAPCPRTSLSHVLSSWCKSPSTSSSLNFLAFAHLLLPGARDRTMTTLPTSCVRFRRQEQGCAQWLGNNIAQRLQWGKALVESNLMASPWRACRWLRQPSSSPLQCMSPRPTMPGEACSSACNVTCPCRQGHGDHRMT